MNDFALNIRFSSISSLDVFKSAPVVHKDQKQLLIVCRVGLKMSDLFSSVPALFYFVPLGRSCVFKCAFTHTRVLSCPLCLLLL